ncbi:hypothetical protein HG531_002723 [Fusarium graminearum]|nr:hypothetical protein HG531_002723 [Fusarium graminearum]
MNKDGNNGESVRRNSNTLELPSIRSTTDDTPQHRLNSKGDGKEVLGTRIALFKPDNLRTTAIGKVACEFHMDGKSGDGKDEANDPVHEGETDGTWLVAWLVAWDFWLKEKPMVEDK